MKNIMFGRIFLIVISLVYVLISYGIFTFVSGDLMDFLSGANDHIDPSSHAYRYRSVMDFFDWLITGNFIVSIIFAFLSISTFIKRLNASKKDPSISMKLGGLGYFFIFLAILAIIVVTFPIWALAFAGRWG